MLTAEQWQQLLLLDVGAGIDGNDPVEKLLLDKITPNINLIWTAWSDKALVFPRLQYLYAKKHCLDIIMGQLRDLVSTTIGGFNSNQQQRLANLQAMHKIVEDDIKKLEDQALAVRPVVIASLTNTSSRMPDPAQVDPNNPVYRGDALVRPLQQDPLGWQKGTS